MHPNKTVIFVGDGMADEPLSELDGQTPLQYANTPAMDSIARSGASGTLLTLPAGFPTSSEVANMSILGCDLQFEYCGRGPLEAAGRGILLGPEDIAFRVNLITIEDGRLKDFSGGHIAQPDAEAIIALLNDHFGGTHIRFHAGVSYRNILVLTGPEFSDDVAFEKPDDNHGESLNDHMPVALGNKGRKTAAFLQRLVKEAPSVLERCHVNKRIVRKGGPMANGVWPWSGGRAATMRTLKEKYSISSAVISAVDVIVGLGRCLGMKVIHVPGATGYIDTNYEGKAKGAIEALREHDLVYVHLEAIDEVSHEQDLAKKLRAIEDFDSRIIGPVLSEAGQDVALAVLPDHPVPVAIGKHTRTPVPVSVRKPGLAPDGVPTFDERACQDGALGKLEKDGLMQLLFCN